MKSLIYFIGLVLLLSACSSNTLRDEIEADKDKYSSVHTREEMMEASHEILTMKEGLPKDQKEAFSELTSRVHREVQEINKEVSRSKLVLFRSLLDDEKAKPQRIDYLTRELRYYHDKKLDIMIEAFFDAKEILGREMLEPVLHDRFHDFWFDEHARQQSSY